MLHTSALAYLLHHHGEYLDGAQPALIQRCTAHLVDLHEVSSTTAEHATLQALGEFVAQRNAPYIDCSRTTSHVLYLFDPTTRQHRAISVARIVAAVP